jgi:hypothetical protein
MDAKRVKSHGKEPSQSYIARTELGRRLLAMRRRIVASRQPLLDRDGVDAEVKLRRGEPAGDR